MSHADLYDGMVDNTLQGIHGIKALLQVHINLDRQPVSIKCPNNKCGKVLKESALTNYACTYCQNPFQPRTLKKADKWFWMKVDAFTENQIRISGTATKAVAQALVKHVSKHAMLTAQDWYEMWFDHKQMDKKYKLCMDINNYQVGMKKHCWIILQKNGEYINTKIQFAPQQKDDANNEEKQE